MKLVFFGTSSFASKVLQTVKKEFEVVLVVTQPDKTAGRKKELSQSQVSMSAKELNLPLLKPEELKSEETYSKLSSTKADIFLVVAYGKIIPKRILDIPLLAAINIHGSLLPKYRGASPIQAALLNGDAETGITIMLMDEQMDHGPILEKFKLKITDDKTFSDLESELGNLASQMISQTIKDYANKKIKPLEQEHTQATYTKIIKKEDGLVNWENSARQIYNQYRAYYIWPGIFTKWQGKILKIVRCNNVKQTQTVQPGLVLLKDQSILVACGQGALELLEVQLEGKKQLNIQDFVRGHKEFIGSQLG